MEMVASISVWRSDSQEVSRVSVCFCEDAECWQDQQEPAEDGQNNLEDG